MPIRKMTIIEGIMGVSAIIRTNAVRQGSDWQKRLKANR
jgi:hypothetical protein